MTKNMISDLVVSWLEQASEDMRCSLAIFERGGWSGIFMPGLAVYSFSYAFSSLVGLKKA